MSSTLSLLQYNHNIITNDTAETLSNALDVDLSNISETGEAAIANVGYPSTTYTSLTIGSSGASYTAPADGWFMVWGTSTATGAYIGLNYVGYSASFGAFAEVSAKSMGTRCILPICEGKKINLEYSSMTMNNFIFTYAKGAV